MTQTQLEKKHSISWIKKLSFIRCSLKWRMNFQRQLKHSPYSMEGVRAENSKPLDSFCLLIDSPHRILKACARGDIKEVASLYEDNPNKILFADSNGWTSVHIAVANNQIDVLEFLVSKGADISVQDNEGKSPLHVAVEKGAVKCIEFLIASGANCEAIDKQTRPPLHLAVTANQAEALQAMMSFKDKIKLHQTDDYGRTALHLAAALDYDDCATILLNNYTTCPNQPCNNGYYPIHLAAKNASVKVVEALLKWAESRGCQRKKMISVPDLEGNLPLHLAVHGGEIKAIELCLKNGARISSQQNDKSTPVHLACSQGAIYIVKLMFRLQPEERVKVLTTSDAQNMTPLHCAVMFDHPELTSYLIQEGADVDALDHESRTPLLLAASQRSWRCVEELLSLGADPFAQDSQKKNILHSVIIKGGNLTDILALLCCYEGNNRPSTAYEGESSHDFIEDQLQGNERCLPKNHDGFNKIKTHINGATFDFYLKSPNLKELLNQKDCFGCTPVHYAARSGQIKSVELLLELGAYVKVKNNNLENPLHLAARYGRYNTIRILVESEQGSLTLNNSNTEGKTPLHIASEEGHTRVVQLLLSKGALLHRDDTGQTPLHLAAKGGFTGTVSALLSIHSHLLDQTDKNGNAPIHLAVRANQTDSITQLMTLGCKMVENTSGFTPVDIAIYYKFHEAATAILAHERGSREVLQSVSSIHGSVCGALIKCLPRVYDIILRQAITTASIKKDSKDYYIHYSFYPLQPSIKDIASDCIKKKEAGWTPPPLYACNIGQRTVPLIAACAILLFAFIGLIKEFFQIYHQRFKYFLDAMNIVEWTLYISSALMVLPSLSGTSWRSYQFSSAAVAVFTSWYTLLLFFQRFDEIGIYIVMFLEILNTLLRVLVIFSVLIIAFSISFFLLLPQHMPFSTIYMSMMRVFTMMLGEINFINSFVYPYFGEDGNVELLFPKTTFNVNNTPMSAENFILEELDSHKQLLRHLTDQQVLQNKMLRLIVQKMEIKTEEEEGDEGVDMEDILNPPFISHRKLALLSVAALETNH